MDEPTQPFTTDWWDAVAAEFPGRPHSQGVGADRESNMLRQDKIVRAGVCCIPFRWNDDASIYEVLLIRRKRSHGAGTWSVPGGWMDFGETACRAAVRELEEEVGIVASERDLEFICYTEDWFEAEGKHCITLWYRCQVDDHAAPVVAPDEVAEFQWVDTSSELPEPLFLPLMNFLKIEGRL